MTAKTNLQADRLSSKLFDVMRHVVIRSFIPGGHFIIVNTNSIIIIIDLVRSMPHKKQ